MMEQLTYVAPGRIETWEVAPPKLQASREAIVRPVAVASCDLDTALVRGLTPWSGPFPLGHEGVAEVIEVGDAVKAISPGDMVCLPYQISCGVCKRCEAGLTAQCDGHGGRAPEGQFYGFSPSAKEWGGFLSDAVRVPFADHMLLKLPEDIEPVLVASLSDNIVDGWRTVAAPLLERPGAPVLVVGGSGAIGLYAVANALALGSEHVVYVDRAPARLEKAAQLGAEVLTVTREWPETLGPYPITVDANSTTRGLLLAMRSTDAGGTCTSAGWYYEPVELPLWDLTLRSVTFKTGLIQARPGMTEVLEMIRAGTLNPGPVTDRVLAWTDAPDALADVHEKLVFVRR
jgi:threonine dehydrogenase-like Zn-dependent dehydrogenase